MSTLVSRQIELQEYQPRCFARDQLKGVGEWLWRNYGNRINVEFPTPATDYQWVLTPQSWIGHIPAFDGWTFVLSPRVPIGNLFRMLEYAYRLDLLFLDDIAGCQSLQEFYERLASILSMRVLDRGRQGLYRAYVPESDYLPYVTGRIDLQELMRTPWSTKLQCHYHEHSADVEENQILAWTLFVIAHSILCTDRVLPTVRRAQRLLQSAVTVMPVDALACVGRLYNRLNDDYEPLHALCRFFLEHSGPAHQAGAHAMLPFVINMSRLFELFVAEWLKAHLRKDYKDYRIRAQETVNIGHDMELQFRIDMVLYDARSGETICVLDTKYKIHDAPSPDDVAQVVAYAEAKGCREAVLVYPRKLRNPFEAAVGRIRVRGLAFSLDGDLEVAGEQFLASLFMESEGHGKR